MKLICTIYLILLLVNMTRLLRVNLTRLLRVNDSFLSVRLTQILANDLKRLNVNGSKYRQAYDSFFESLGFFNVYGQSLQ